MDFQEIQNNISNTPGFISQLGINIVEYSLGYCKGEMLLNESMNNPYGSVHGGCIFSLADTIGGCAALTHGKKVVTVNSSINYLSPAINIDKLIAHTREVKYGSTIAVYDVIISDSTEKLIATATMSYYICE